MPKTMSRSKKYTNNNTCKISGYLHTNTIEHDFDICTMVQWYRCRNAGNAGVTNQGRSMSRSLDPVLMGIGEG